MNMNISKIFQKANEIKHKDASNQGSNKPKKYTSRKIAILALNSYQAKNASSGQDSRTVSVPRYVLANILAKAYHFAIYPKQGAVPTRLMFYCDDKRSSHYGLYDDDYNDFDIEIKHIYPKFSKRDLADLIDNIIATDKVKLAQRNGVKEQNYIPVGNGLLNKKTLKLRPYSPDFVYTVKIVTDWNPKAKKPVIINGWSFEKYLQETIGASQIETALQVMYDAFDGRTSRGRFPFLIGKPHTGKSTFQDIIEAVIGDGNYATTRLTDFGKSFGLSRLPGSICDLGDNISTNAFIDGKSSEQIHSLTTGDPVDVNIKNITPFSFYYSGTIISSTNGYPKFADKAGIKSRILFVRFSHDFGDKAKHTRGNSDVKSKYIRNKRMREHILYTVLSRGDFQDYHISKTDIKEVNEWNLNNDPVEQFKREVFLDWKLDRMPVNIAFKMYNNWSKVNHYTFLSKRSFIEKLSRSLQDEPDDSKYKVGKKRLTDSDATALNDLSDKSDYCHYIGHVDNAMECFYRVDAPENKPKTDVSDDDKATISLDEHGRKINISNDNLPF